MRSENVTENHPKCCQIRQNFISNEINAAEKDGNIRIRIGSRNAASSAYPQRKMIDSTRKCLNR